MLKHKVEETYSCWIVCDDCGMQYGPHGSESEAIRRAREYAWEIHPSGIGGDHYCPKCATSRLYVEEENVEL